MVWLQCLQKDTVYDRERTNLTKQIRGRYEWEIREAQSSLEGMYTVGEVSRILGMRLLKAVRIVT